MSSVLTIGNFDGVHVGHCALVRAACERARRDRSEVVAVTLEPHPAVVLRPDVEPGSGQGHRALTPRVSERVRLLRAAGADRVRVLDARAGWLGLEAGEFIERIVSEEGAVAVVEGPDFRFGRGRGGDMGTLRAVGKARGLEVIEARPVEVGFVDQTVVRASSTWVRRRLAEGRVRDAAAVLGRPYAVAGRVVRGDQRGRAIGFPTANVETGGEGLPRAVVPGEGVYAAVASVRASEGGPVVSRVPAAVNIGASPTFGVKEPRIEAHLLGALEGGSGGQGGDVGRWVMPAGLGEYGWWVELEFIGWVRDQVRLSGVAALVDQLRRDVWRVREMTAGVWGEAGDGYGAGQRREEVCR